MHMNFLTPEEHDRIHMVGYDSGGGEVTDVFYVAYPTDADIAEIESATEKWLCENPFIKLNGAFADLSCTIRAATDTMAHLLGITRKVFETCPDRRVVHLAGHGRTWRTRKKNVRRAFKILEKERCRACPKT